MSRRRLVVPALLLVSAVALSTNAGPAVASSPNPARPAAMRAHAHRSTGPSGATITAVVVKSWGQCSSGSLIWDDLNANWSSYGTIPISIDYSNPSLCGSGTVTLAALEASGANVVILSDPAGGVQQFSPDEVTALQTYLEEGHNIIGTYLTFAYPTGGIDNSALAPLFGLKATAGWTGGTTVVTPTYRLRYPGLPLFRNISNPYVSAGYNYAQTPGDGAWSINELQGGKLVGRTADAMGAIVARKAAAGYYSVFISNMPEYVGGTTDKQFFYNAIIFPATGS
ncbi:MAG TPA: hypothetical protein VGA30_02970 [Actinomycetota bacterium]